MTRGFGYIPSPPDVRDRKLVGAEDALFGLETDQPPTECFDLLPYISFVCDQQSTQSCVWNAIQQQHFIAQGVQGVAKRVRLSRAYGYWHTRKKSGTQDADIGCIPRFAWKAAQGMGLCPEALWDFQPESINRPPSFDATSGAIDQKWVQGYYNIWGLTGRSHEVRTAISKGHPVVFGTPVGQGLKDFRHTGSTNPRVLSYPRSEILGRHMMCAVAYDSDGLWVVNSWGTDWGAPDPSFYFQGGFFRMAWDWVDWPLAVDWWAVQYAKEFVR